MAAGWPRGTCRAKNDLAHARGPPWRRSGRCAGSRRHDRRETTMTDMRVRWPNGARVAVALTFDFDAETLWLARDPENARRPGILSQGTYGAKVGVPKILETL